MHAAASRRAARIAARARRGRAERVILRMIYSFSSRASGTPSPYVMSRSARIFLIDGSSQMYRAYHAMRGSGLTGPGGRSTHAVYIFVTMLRKLIQDHQPEYLAASFDLAGPTFRSEM